jgi:hypothetical protein
MVSLGDVTPADAAFERFWHVSRHKYDQVDLIL